MQWRGLTDTYHYSVGFNCFTIQMHSCDLIPLSNPKGIVNALKHEVKCYWIALKVILPGVLLLPCEP